MRFARYGQELYIYYETPCQDVGCVLMQEEKVVPCLLSQLRKRELDYPTYYVELSIVEHGSASFWGVKVTSKWITRI